MTAPMEAPSRTNPRCIRGVEGCTCLDVLDEAEAAPVRYRVVDGPEAGTIVDASERQDCLFCGSLDPHCPTCLGGYVLGWEPETNRPTGRLEPVT